MRPFTFVLLATVTAAVAVEAVHMVRDQAADTAPEVTGGAPLVPGLNEHINQVVALTVAGGRGSVTIARSGPDSDRWTVAEKANYPAALDQVRRVILGVDAAVRDSAVAMGMTRGQILRMVELPLAAPTIVSGLRIATVTTVGTATIAAAIGAGGLGELIFRGVASVDNSLVLAGAIPAALLALFADGVLGLLERRLKVRA